MWQWNIRHLMWVRCFAHLPSHPHTTPPGGSTIALSRGTLSTTDKAISWHHTARVGAGVFIPVLGWFRKSPSFMETVFFKNCGWNACCSLVPVVLEGSRASGTMGQLAALDFLVARWLWFPMNGRVLYF